jgi:hypothetical protein
MLSAVVALIALAGASEAEPYKGRRLSPSAAEAVMGDRLFFETRFSQFAFAHAKNDLNAALPAGDPMVSEVERPGKPSLTGPFQGQGISCRHCHLGDDFMRLEPQAQRTYCDFSARSGIPRRDDGQTHTIRNTQAMVDLGLPAEVPLLLHFDGEFASVEDLVVGTLTGRNMGWGFDEYAVAVAHIARVVREDTGAQARFVRDASGRGISYAKAFLGLDSTFPTYLRIPPQYRINVRTASDTEVVLAVARFIHAYIDSLRFGYEAPYRDAVSPYDRFLQLNGLPAGPNEGEPALEYSRRLLRLIQGRNKFVWVMDSLDDRLQLHAQSFRFGPQELRGLKRFFTESTNAKEEGAGGNCIQCHTAPRFTDRRFHNTGVAQMEYDAVFGEGAFAQLDIPSLSRRSADSDAYLPPTTSNPDASGRFRSIPSKQRPGFADLGVWNIYANAEFPRPQGALTEILCSSLDAASSTCSPTRLLPLTIGRFRTPSIRDLGHSEPYLHSGAAPTLEDVVTFYIRSSGVARDGRLRNAAPELLSMRLRPSDVAPIAAFLRALNEDYH